VDRDRLQGAKIPRSSWAAAVAATLARGDGGGSTARTCAAAVAVPVAGPVPSCAGEGLSHYLGAVLLDVRHRSQQWRRPNDWNCGVESKMFGNGAVVVAATGLRSCWASV